MIHNNNVLEPIYIPRALNTGISIILFSRPKQEPALAAANTGKNSGEFLDKNEGEWTGKVEFRREEIPGSRRSKHGYTPTYPRL